MKESFYFPHDYTAHTDPKIECMLFEMGWEGYGIFWALIEKLAQETSHKLEINHKKYAFALRTHEESIQKVIEKYSLFEIKDGYFFSNRLLSHFAEREEKKKKAQNSAGQRWHKNEKKDANASGVHMLNDSKRNAIKERKGKERKEKKNTNTDSFLSFWNLYPRKIGKPAALKKYREKEKDDIEKGLALWCDYWIAAETEQQFIPHPATWLNQERWKDIPPEVEGVSSFDLDGAQK